MIPFPGESVWISDAADVTGTPDGTLYEDIVHRAGSRTLAAGEEWRALVYSGDMDYAEGPLDAAVQWAVEVVSGTVTLSAAEGLDPTYADYGTTLGTSLGSHTVTGPGTLLIDSTFTADQVADLDGTVSAAFQLGLTATSGSAVVQQIKLRVWPVGGAHGAFVEQPGFDTTPVAAGVRVVADDITRSGEALTPGVEASWDAAADALVADTIPAGPYTLTPATLVGGHQIGEAQFAGSQSNVDGTNLQTTLSAGSMVARVEGADWTSAGHVGPGVTGYTRPPEEVREDDQAFLYPQTGTGSTGWVDAGLVIEQTGQAAAVVPAFTLATTTGDTPDVAAVIDAGAALSAPTAGGTLTTTHALPTDARYLFAHVSHTGALDAAAWPGTSPGSPLDPAVTTGIDAVVHFGVGDPAGDFAPIKTYAHMPAYRVWMPDAVTATVAPLRLMQRSDGLGMGSGRVFGVGTRQASTRVFGSL